MSCEKRLVMKACTTRAPSHSISTHAAWSSPTGGVGIPAIDPSFPPARLVKDELKKSSMLFS